MSEKDLAELESRLSEIEERVYSSQDSGKKIGKLQTRMRKLNDKLESLMDQVQEHETEMDRLEAESDVRDELETLIKKFRKQKEESIHEVDEATEKSLSDLNEKLDELDQKVGIASEIVDQIDPVVNSFDDFTDEVQKALQRPAYKVECMNAVVATMVARTYFHPEGGRPQSLVFDKLFAMDSMSGDDMARFSSFIALVVEVTETENVRRIIPEPNKDPEFIASLMAMDLVHYVAEDNSLDLSNPEQVMGDKFVNSLADVYGESQKTMDRILDDTSSDTDFWMFSYEVVSEKPEERIESICETFDEIYDTSGEPNTSDLLNDETVNHIQETLDLALGGDSDE